MSNDDNKIKTIDDLTPHGGIDPRSYLGYAWEIIDSSVGQDWIQEFADLRDGKWTDVRCDSCGDIVHMGHDEPDGVWVRIDRLAVCGHCVLEKALGIDVKTSGDRDE